MFKKRAMKKVPTIKDDQLMLAAIGVMNDEFNGPVPMDEINFCLRIDFKCKIKDSMLLSLLNYAINSNMIIKEPNGYLLTPQGDNIADEVLKQL